MSAIKIDVAQVSVYLSTSVFHHHLSNFWLTLNSIYNQGWPWQFLVLFPGARRAEVYYYTQFYVPDSNPGLCTSRASTLEAELWLPAAVLVLYLSDASFKQFETFLDSMSTNLKWRPGVCEWDLFSIVRLCQLQEGVIKWLLFSHQRIRWHGSRCSLISWPWTSHR